MFLPGEEFAPTEGDDLLKDSFGERGLVKTAAQVEMQASQQPESQPLVIGNPSYINSLPVCSWLEIVTLLDPD